MPIKPHTILGFSSNILYFYCIPARNIYYFTLQSNSTKYNEPAVMDIYFLSGTNFPIYFFLFLNHEINRMGHTPNFMCPRCEHKMSLILIWPLVASCSKLLLALWVNYSIRTILLISLVKFVSKIHWKLSS